jgi:P22 coat protein - gene protein 5.
MANTITNLIPILYAALDTVRRELIGFIPAVARDSSAEQAALNQNVNIFIVPPIAGQNVTPGVTAPNDGDAVIGNTTMTISKSRYWPIRWNGEEMKAVTGSGQQKAVIQDQFTQAFRASCNEVEADLADAAYKAASRAFGSAGNAPFATAGDLSDAAGVMKIMDDNGTPLTGRQLVLGSSAMANIRGKQSVLFKVNESGTDELLRQGIIGRLEGMDLRNSGGVKTPTKGTGASYTTTAAGFAIGTVDIPLITGTGTVLAGDVVTFAGDTNKYVVAVGVAAPGTITLNQPGLLQAIPASATALTVGNTATQNVAFYRNAIQLATRVPAMPEGGDMADDVMTLTDPISGLSFQICVYRQYKQVRWEVGLAWGVKAVKQEMIVNLIG